MHHGGAAPGVPQHRSGWEPHSIIPHKAGTSRSHPLSLSPLDLQRMPECHPQSVHAVEDTKALGPRGVWGGAQGIPLGTALL